MIACHTFVSQEVAGKTADFTFHSLKKFLKSGPVLFLISGGSVGRDVAPVVFQRLQELPKSSLGRLHVALVDERFGVPWHKESNMRLLRDVGVIDRQEKLGIKLFLPLVDGSRSLERMSRDYNRVLVRLIALCKERSLGVFGVGSDGHTAGIKPFDSAQGKPVQEAQIRKLFEGRELVVGYTASDFSRITLTPAGIGKLGQVIIYAKGDEKRVALSQMLKGSKNLVFRYPAILFQSQPRVHLFTDIAFH